MNLVMNLRDLELLEQGTLKAFAVPQSWIDDADLSQPIGIREPFKRLTIMETVENNGETQEKKTLVGVKYRTDGAIFITRSDLDTSQIEEAMRWSPAAQLPDFAIRRFVNVDTVSNEKPIRSFTEAELRLMHLDYAPQNDPQIPLEEYLPIKNFELLYGWWKAHYKATLKNCDNPLAVLFHLQSSL